MEESRNVKELSSLFHSHVATCFLRNASKSINIWPCSTRIPCSCILCAKVGFEKNIGQLSFFHIISGNKGWGPLQSSSFPWQRPPPLRSSWTSTRARYLIRINPNLLFIREMRFWEWVLWRLDPKTISLMAKFWFFASLDHQKLDHILQICKLGKFDFAVGSEFIHSCFLMGNGVFRCPDWVPLRLRALRVRADRGQGEGVRQEKVLLQGSVKSSSQLSFWHAKKILHNFLYKGSGSLGGWLNRKRQSRDYCSFDRMNWVQIHIFFALPTRSTNNVIFLSK